MKEVKDSQLEAAKKRLRELSKDGWSVVQLFLQEIQANDLVTHLVRPKQSKVTLKQQVETLKERIEFEFEDDPDVKKLIIDTFPTYNTIRRWTKTQAWQNSVYDSIKYANLYDNEHKANVIRGIYEKATAEGRQDMKAAELYFKIYENVFGKKGSEETGGLEDELTSVVLGKKKAK